jgi:hypothetical protein
MTWPHAHGYRQARPGQRDDGIATAGDTDLPGSCNARAARYANQADAKPVARFMLTRDTYESVVLRDRGPGAIGPQHHQQQTPSLIATELMNDRQPTTI